MVYLLNSCFIYKAKKSRYVRVQGADCHGETDCRARFARSQ